MVETDPPEGRPYVDLSAAELTQLSGLFAAPPWLRRLGKTSWLLVGIALVVVGVIWMLGIASTIVGPVLLALVLAAITDPIVTGLERRKVHRAIGAAAVLLTLVLIVGVIGVLIIQGLGSDSSQIDEQAGNASSHLHSWLESLGVSDSGADKTTSNLQSSIPQLISVFVKGVAAGINGLVSISFFVSFLLFSLFFALKDAPKIRALFQRHLGVPMPIATLITGEVEHSLRRYFLGTTIVGGFNAIVVGLGAVILDVPLALTIAVVTLVTAYIPFVGAVVSGAFAVILAFGSQGTTTALIMLVIVILANGLLQNIISPLAMGATLDLNPLLILIVTISAGAFFGAIGMVLAAPLTSAGLHIATRVGRIRAVPDPA